jgi:Zn-dependent oligopeptidase
MKTEEFIQWLNGYIDGLENKYNPLPQDLKTIKTKLSQIEKKYINNVTDDDVIYSIIAPPKDRLSDTDNSTGGFLHKKDLIKG